MRIRKHAAKLLLGSACPPLHSPPRPSTPPPPPVDDRSATVGDGLLLCQLNCSPWDVMDANSFYFHQEGGEEGMEGIMGNVFGLSDEEGILGISEAFTRSRVAVGDQPYFNCEEEDYSDQKKKFKNRRRRKKKKKNDEDYEEEKTSIVTVIVNGGVGGGQVTGICKKNDGKGWHCNKPANRNHTLCDHHLTQLKSYSSTRYNSVAREEEAVDGHDSVPRVKTSRRPNANAKAKAKAAASGSKSAGDGYYYYSGFGLQRGKARSNGGKEGLAGKSESETGDGSDAPIADADLDDDDTDEDVKIVANVDNNKGGIRRKKRGRKPVKARSLMSLL